MIPQRILTLGGTGLGPLTPSWIVNCFKWELDDTQTGHYHLGVRSDTQTGRDHQAYCSGRRIADVLDSIRVAGGLRRRLSLSLSLGNVVPCIGHCTDTTIPDGPAPPWGSWTPQRGGPGSLKVREQALVRLQHNQMEQGSEQTMPHLDMVGRRANLFE